MFAIALWDGRKRRLILARDRIGKKPLFYAHRNGELAFGSEVKALAAWPHLERKIRPEALHDYLSFLHVPAPTTIFDRVQKLPPAHLLAVDCGSGQLTLERYWRCSPEPDRSQPLSYYEEGIRAHVDEAVRLRLRSDVPLGAFLSGGIDSTIVSGLMARQAENVRTFNIGFSDRRFDESDYARTAARAFGTVHREEVVDAEVLPAEELPRLVWFMDEPFADSSFLPTYWLCRAAREEVTVALSGDGADELFAGYPRYRHLQRIQRLRRVPRLLRGMGEGALGTLRAALQPFSPGLSESLRRVVKALQLSSLSIADQILAIHVYFQEAQKTSLYSADWRDALNGRATRLPVWGPGASTAEGHAALVALMATDFETNMVDGSLVKVDRASMACSLEVRSPFLDHHVVEFAMRIPPEYKLQGGTSKAILRSAFADLLPPDIAIRGKQGFDLPFAAWFRQGSWRELLIDSLSRSRLRQQGIFDADAVIRLRDLFLQDPEARHAPVSAYVLRHQVWALLVFQVWYEQFMRGLDESHGLHEHPGASLLSRAHAGA
jgi:asparagine synthase (glutamine-hydrolysing)